MSSSFEEYNQRGQEDVRVNGRQEQGPEKMRRQATQISKKKSGICGK